MSDKLPKFHKTLLILLLVLTPPYWLLFTDEGARVSDSALLWLLGEQDIKVSIGAIDNGFSQADILAVYSQNEWHCDEKRTSFGSAICAAKVGTFNGFPARLITFYFRNDRVNAMKLIYRDPYHDQILGYLIGKFGQPENVAAAVAAGPQVDTVLQWRLEKGALLLKKALQQTDEPALLWIAGSSPS